MEALAASLIYNALSLEGKKMFMQVDTKPQRGMQPMPVILGALGTDARGATAFLNTTPHALSCVGLSHKMKGTEM